MKKALAILASFGLVATSSFSVIACAEKVDESNINTTLRSLESWFTDAQPQEVDGEMREGKTMVIAVGGRKNSDTLSYLATLNKLVNDDGTADANTLTSTERVENLDKQINELTNTEIRRSGQGTWQRSINDNLIIATRDANDWRTNDNIQSNIAKNYLKATIDHPVENVEFHTILVDRIEQFWNTTTGRGFLNNILRAQITDFYQFLGTRDPENASNALGVPLTNELADIVTSDIRRTALINDKSESLTRIINQKENLGPWFFVVRSGKVVGVKTGFRNYYEFNKEYTEEEREANAFTRNPDLTKTTFEQFTKSLGEVLKDGIQFFDKNFVNDSRDIRKSNYLTKNSPAEAWNSKTSGTSNITDLDDPRGEGIKKEENKTDKDKDKNKDNNNKTPEPKPDDSKDKGRGQEPKPDNKSEDEQKGKDLQADTNKANIEYHFSFLD